MLRIAVAALFVWVAWWNAAAAQWRDTPAVKALHDAARQEGEVVLWGPQQRDLNWVARAFGAMFPGVAVRTLADADAAARIVTDSRTNTYVADVLWTSLPAGAPAIQRSLAATPDWSQFGVAEDDVAFDGRMAFTNNTVYVVAYSTDHAKDSDIPESWADFADQRLAGKMATSLYALPRLTAGLAQNWGEERALQFTRDLVQRAEIMVTRGPRDGYLKSGERPIALAELDGLARLWVGDGLPIRYKLPQPVVAAQYGVISLAHAPHPNAALLLAGWLASPEGKAARERATGAIDYRPSSRNAAARALHARGVPFVFENAADVRTRDALTERLTFLLSNVAR